MHPEALRILLVYSFPGNLLELVNILDRACLLAAGRQILPEHLPDDFRAPFAPST